MITKFKNYAGARIVIMRRDGEYLLSWSSTRQRAGIVKHSEAFYVVSPLALAEAFKLLQKSCQWMNQTAERKNLLIIVNADVTTLNSNIYFKPRYLLRLCDTIFLEMFTSSLTNFISGGSRAPTRLGPKALTPRDYLSSAPPIDAPISSSSSSRPPRRRDDPTKITNDDNEDTSTIPLTSRDTLQSLSLRFGVSENVLRSANDLPPNGNLALLGGFIKVPVAISPRPKREEGVESLRAKIRRVRVITNCDENSAAFYVADAEGDVEAAIEAYRRDDAFENSTKTVKNSEEERDDIPFITHDIDRGDSTSGGGGGGGGGPPRSSSLLRRRK